MMDGMTGQIELRPTEQKVLGQLVLDHAGSVRLTYEETIANVSELQVLLPASSAGKLFLNQATIFWRSRLQISNPSDSLRGIFLRQRRTDEVMFRHPHFLKHRRYFVFGADLPAHIKAAFYARFDESYGDREQLVKLPRLFTGETWSADRFKQMRILSARRSAI
jgi:hypothetical protein